MIVKAMKFGVQVSEIAETLSIDESKIRSRLKLLNGIHAGAVELLKDKQITASVIRVLRKVSAVRQIEVAELMMMNDFTKAMPTRCSWERRSIGQSGTGKKVPNLSAEEVVRMERELESLERDFKAVEASYGENMLNLTVMGATCESCLITSAS